MTPEYIKILRYQSQKTFFKLMNSKLNSFCVD
jgi:hypothetical protein